MYFLSALCGCFTRDENLSQPHPSSEVVAKRLSPNGIQTGRFTLSAEGEFIRPASPAPPAGSHGHGPPPSDSQDGGYSSVVPLPQYSARPMSLHEKTLEAHMRDPSISSESQNFCPNDEKNDHYDGDLTSDSSSAVSFPSSYGNTSTATRDTPPPPYSPRQSVVLSRSRSMSISSTMAVIINPPPAARMSGSRTGPTYSEEDDQSLRRHRRVSWESR
ncbi:hypothetical protein DTO013E5_7335 [Penicillium roqueforti]|uniref:Genomic scaffold, ProqFM164S03 n=1 Tax=Penicillium roqueforti (strain FM164) TaxID=1365484 RepID=W6QGZ9_PENRF|nr:uncharacterized protein LCP9604111_3095 [Penicillium roqueforti]CDM33469.1 unnamed protein product [Penicillium roqueforti FM164]KAF9250891.1 hypothetical protein LCP9604111_3095 [Penicillium roqueforti]KAI1830957.1 hypothetical protein CBS147337_8314 [Penicillium roqueforti]KAI2681512.1 hypothetical protein CBS147355_2722 [Penicillium roqueforti]KAI2688900.1 hypothetical protein LCP963914a_1989 [Penicillium roqueforti]